MESVIDPRMQYVFVGDHVFIQRSKRIAYQKAEVVSVTPKHGFVNVEWHDADGNLWGREVSIRDVLDLNPSLVTNRSQHTPISSGSICSYQPILHQDSTDGTTRSKDSTSTVDGKWLEDMQARLADARIRGTTLPKNVYLRKRSFCDSGSENGEDANDNASESSRVTTLRMVGGGAKHFNNRISSCASNQGNAPHDSKGDPPADQADSQEHRLVYYDKHHSNNNQFSAYKPRSLDNPFYTPLMKEMHATQTMQVQTNHAQGTVPKHRNASMNETRSFHLGSTYSTISTKKTCVPKRNTDNFKPSTPGVNQSPKCKNNDAALAYSRASVAKTSYSTNTNVARRPPTAVPSVKMKSNTDCYLLALPAPPPPTTGTQSKHKSSVVETIQRLERDRELRRRKQEEKRAEENALRMKDPGNVNWKFALMVHEYRRTILRDPLTMIDPVKQTRIIVCIRKRPLSAKEVERKEIDIITMPNKDLVLIHEPKAKLDMTKYLENHCFRFDYTFDENSTNEMVYHFTTKSLIETFFEGGTATVFAYGQTGSGKTHTMGGNFVGTKQDSNNGIYMNVARDIFSILSSAEFQEQGLRLSVAFFEIYKGKLFDLLSGKNEIKVMEDVEQQIQLVGLTELYVNSLGEVVSLIRKGNAARTSGKTTINPMSSRSHSVFQLILRQDSGDDHKGPVYGKFSLIDLAGNERGVGKGAAVDRQLEIEGAEINKSLLALKECIRALARNEGVHIPFRGSKLTLVLKDTFMNANSRVCMIGTVSPGHSSCNCSLNTILYANRVKEFNANDSLVDEVANSEKE